ncbi:peptidoglycan editing factor PgeF [Falsiroseomonas oryziterrae]|uniref:peptidoglycan editing factor PgeF n=1 Tax=Falsiroseomonas oryziterrae TaxID=2911368 RepID=UPI001F42CE4B|nr:peptidoglycan editing factor PgeF [Roseomonas sp. NPKOSM-4]
MTPPVLTAGLAVPHGFFTRRGGVSSGRFASLNCSLSGRDDAAAVAENRARAAGALGQDPARLVGLTQVHGVAVAEVTEPWPQGARPEADAMVTDRPGLLLGIVTGDCAPVLFADAAAGVVGAAHAGWRGAVAGVLEETVAAMERLGAARDRIVAAIGPCIAQRSYEVGPDLRDALLARDAADARFLAQGRREDRWQFDLPGYCLARLAALGVGAAWTGHDTLAEEEDFFSHRRSTLSGGGPIGHQLSAIALPG